MRTSALRFLCVVAVAWLPASPALAQQRYEVTGVRSAEIGVSGASTAGITVSGTWLGTLSFKVANGRETTPVTVDCATPAAPGTAVNTTTGTGSWTCPVAGWARLVVSFDAYTSGTALLDVLTSAGPGQTVAAAGGGGSFDGVLLDAAGGDPLTDTANNALKVNVVAGAGGGVSALEDVASAGADPGTPAYAVRNDTVTGATSTDGDYQPLKSDSAGRLYTTGTGGTFPVSGTAATDAAVSGNPVYVAGRASAAAPSDVSADNDVVPLWLLRNGAQAVQQAFAGVLAVAGNGASGTGVQRVTIANDSTGVLATVSTVTTLSQFGGQAITLGAGAVAAGTLRITQASDSPAVTALQLVDNPVGSPTGGAAGTSSYLAGAVYNSSPPSLTNGQQAGLQLNSSGALIVTGAAGTTQYAEDAAHQSGDQLVALGAVRRDTTPSSSSGTAGDYSAVNVDANGRVYTQAVLYNSSGSEITPAVDVTEDAAETPGGTGPHVMSTRRDTSASSAGSNSDIATINTDARGRLWVMPGGPCQDHARLTTVAIGNSTSGNVEVVALNGSDLIYVCGYSLMAGAATGVRFVYGTGTACATGETGLTGVWPFAANGGITQANGGVPQFVVPAGNAFCTENSGANAIAGHVTYVRTASP